MRAAGPSGRSIVDRSRRPSDHRRNGAVRRPLHAEQLAAAFATVRRRCRAQLVLFGTGPHRTTVVRRAFAHGVGADVHLLRSIPAGRWSDVVAAADVVVPSTALGQVSLLDVLSACRPVVAPIDPTTMRLVVPTSAGLVYRPGDVSGMAAALLRLLTTPALRHGMACRARRSRPATSAADETAAVRRREPTMRNVLGRLLMWVAEILDRNLLTVPEIDEYDSPSAVLHVQARMQE